MAHAAARLAAAFKLSTALASGCESKQTKPESGGVGRSSGGNGEDGSVDVLLRQIKEHRRWLKSEKALATEAGIPPWGVELLASAFEEQVKLSQRKLSDLYFALYLNREPF